MLYGRDLTSMIALIVAWALAAGQAARCAGAASGTALGTDPGASARRARRAQAGLAVAGAAASSLALQHLARLGFYLDDQKRWPGTVLAVVPVVAAAGLAVPRLRRAAVPTTVTSTGTAVAGTPDARDARAAAVILRAGLYSAVALTGFELFPHDRLRALDCAVPLLVTAAAVALDAAAGRRRAGTGAGTGAGTRTWSQVSAGAGVAGLGVAVLAGVLIGAGVTAPRRELPRQVPVAVRSGHVTTEGDTLYYEVRGRGEPLLLIPGAGGDGGYYSRLADVLAADHEVITYDRRGNARSTRHLGTFSIEQQARDAAAVIRAAGHESALVAGSSGGALIGLRLAADLPRTVRALVVHEAPVVTYDRRWDTFFRSVLVTAGRYGTTVAAQQFLFGLGIPASAFGATPAEAQQRGYDTHYLIATELAGMTFTPAVDRIRAGGVPVVCAVGDLTRRQGRITGAAMPRLARELHAPLVVFPGHHLSYQDDPAGWAAALRGALATATGTP